MTTQQEFFNFLSTVGEYFGGIDQAMKVLVLFMVFDYFSGSIKACKEKRLSSKIGFIGIGKKVLELLLVAMAVALDVLFNMNGGMRTLIVYSFIANEGISILENVSAVGVPVPQKIKEVLLNLKENQENPKNQGKTSNITIKNNVNVNEDVNNLEK